MTAPTITKPKPLHPFASPWQIPGQSEDVTLVKGVDCFTVQVRCGTKYPDGWTASYSTEAEARAEIRRAVRVIVAFGGTEQIRRHREALIHERTEQERRQLRRMHNAVRLAEIRAELEATEPIGDRQGRLKMAAEFAATYGPVAA